MRLESERFELAAPLRRSIAKPFHADAAGEASFDGGANKVWGKKGQGDGHVDLTRTAVLASSDFFDVGDQARDNLV